MCYCHGGANDTNLGYELGIERMVVGWDSVVDYSRLACSASI